jgi:hypothetical protein
MKVYNISGELRLMMVLMKVYTFWNNKKETIIQSRVVYFSFFFSLLPFNVGGR